MIVSDPGQPQSGVLVAHNIVTGETRQQEPSDLMALVTNFVRETISPSIVSAITNEEPSDDLVSALGRIEQLLSRVLEAPRDTIASESVNIVSRQPVTVTADRIVPPVRAPRNDTAQTTIPAVNVGRALPPASSDVIERTLRVIQEIQGERSARPRSRAQRGRRTDEDRDDRQERDRRPRRGRVGQEDDDRRVIGEFPLLDRWDRSRTRARLIQRFPALNLRGTTPFREDRPRREDRQREDRPRREDRQREDRPRREDRQREETSQREESTESRSNQPGTLSRLLSGDFAGAAVSFLGGETAAGITDTFGLTGSGSSRTEAPTADAPSGSNKLLSKKNLAVLGGTLLAGGLAYGAYKLASDEPKQDETLTKGAPNPPSLWDRFKSSIGFGDGDATKSTSQPSVVNPGNLTDTAPTPVAPAKNDPAPVAPAKNDPVPVAPTKSEPAPVAPTKSEPAKATTPDKSASVQRAVEFNKSGLVEQSPVAVSDTPTLTIRNAPVGNRTPEHQALLDRTERAKKQASNSGSNPERAFNASGLVENKAETPLMLRQTSGDPEAEVLEAVTRTVQTELEFLNTVPGEPTPVITRTPEHQALLDRTERAKKQAVKRVSKSGSNPERAFTASGLVENKAETPLMLRQTSGDPEAEVLEAVTRTVQEFLTQDTTAAPKYAGSVTPEHQALLDRTAIARTASPGTSVVTKEKTAKTPGATSEKSITSKQRDAAIAAIKGLRPGEHMDQKTRDVIDAGLSRADQKEYLFAEGFSGAKEVSEGGLFVPNKRGAATQFFGEPISDTETTKAVAAPYLSPYVIRNEETTRAAVPVTTPNVGTASVSSNAPLVLARESRPAQPDVEGVQREGWRDVVRSMESILAGQQETSGPTTGTPHIMPNIGASNSMSLDNMPLYIQDLGLVILNAGIV